MRKQKSFIGAEFVKPGSSFGGELLKNSNAKVRRPLDSRLPVHLVLKSTESVLRVPKNFARVNELVGRICRKHGVKLYQYANVGNHLHMLLKIRSRPSWAAFIRELTGVLASAVKIKWFKRPFTRVVGGWRTAFRSIKSYVLMNQLEADGHIDRKETKTLKDLRAIWWDG